MRSEPARWCPECGGVARLERGGPVCAAKSPCGYGARPWWQDLGPLRPFSGVRPRPYCGIVERVSRVGRFAFVPEWDER